MKNLFDNCVIHFDIPFCRSFKRKKHNCFSRCQQFSGKSQPTQIVGSRRKGGHVEIRQFVIGSESISGIFKSKEKISERQFESRHSANHIQARSSVERKFGLAQHPRSGTTDDATPISSPSHSSQPTTTTTTTANSTPDHKQVVSTNEASR